MMISQTISGEADSAANRYGMLVEAWRSGYARALDQSHFGSPKLMSQVVSDAYEVAGLFLNSEWQVIEDTSARIALEAQRVTQAQLSVASALELSGAVSEHLNELNAYLTHEITIQIERDIAFLKQSLQSTFLNVSMSARAQQIDLRSALMQYRIGNASEMNFFFRDRRGQKWPSRRFIRSVWRQHLLTAYNETVLLTLVDHGIDTAFVEHADQKAPAHGMEISINTDTALPSYGEAKNDLFHPNSDAYLTRVLA